MAKNFNLTANLVLAGPSNLKPIVSQIQSALNNIKADVDVKINPASITGINNLNTAFKTFNATLITAKTNISSVAIALGQLNSSIGNVKLNNLNQQLSQVSTQQKILTNNLRAGRTELEEFGRVSGLAVRRFAGFAATTGVIMGIMGAIKNATGAAIDFQNQMVKLGQLTGGSVTGMYKQFGDQITQLSVGLGVSSQKLGEVAHKLVQAGLSAREMSQVMEALAKSMNAPAFHDVDQTMEGTIAMMKQFGIQAKDVEASLSSMHAMASKYAVESQDLISAIRISGGAFATMSKGVVEGREALNQFMALFTSIRGTTRESAESIATGLRTIFARLERPEAIVALKQLGVELVDLNGKFVGPYEAINRLSTALKGLDPRDIRYAGIAEALGGYRQIGKVLPLLQQVELRQKAFNTAQAGSNQLNEANVKAMQSWEVQLGKVHERFLALVRDVSQTQGFKDLMNIFLAMANGLIRLGEALKPVLPLLAAIMAYKGVAAGGQLMTGLMSGLRGRTMATGGLVPGSGNGDTVPAVLTPGEFVVRKNAVQAIGAQNLSRLNGYAAGGVVTMTPEHEIGKQMRSNWVGAQVGHRKGIMIGSVGSNVTNYIRGDAMDMQNHLGNKLAHGLAERVGFMPTHGSLSADIPYDGNQAGALVGFMFENILARLTGGFTGANRGRVDFAGGFDRAGADGKSLGEHLGLSKEFSGLSPIEARSNIKNTKLIEMVDKFHAHAAGGTVSTPNAMLTPGEFVIGASAASSLGPSTLHSINNADRLPGFANGGGWGGYGPGTPGMRYHITHALKKYTGSASLIGGVALQSLAPENEYIQAAGSAMEGASLGTQIAGPWGGIAGGVLGGATSMLQAPGVKAQKEADNALRKSEEELGKAFDKLSKGGSLEDFDNALKNSAKAIEQKSNAENLQNKLSSGNMLGLFGSGGAVKDKVAAQNGFLDNYLYHPIREAFDSAGTTTDDAQQMERARTALAGDFMSRQQKNAAMTLQAHEKVGKKTYTSDELKTLAYMGDDAEILATSTIRAQEHKGTDRATMLAKIAIEEEKAGQKVADASNKAADDLAKFTDTIVRGDAVLARFVLAMEMSSAQLNRVQAIGGAHMAVINAEGAGGIMGYHAEDKFKNPLAFNDLGSTYLRMLSQFGKPGEHNVQAAKYMDETNMFQKNLPNILQRVGRDNSTAPVFGMINELSKLGLPPEMLEKAKAQLDKLYTEKSTPNMSGEMFLQSDPVRNAIINILKAFQGPALENASKTLEAVDSLLENQRAALEKQYVLQIQINEKTASIASLQGVHALTMFKAQNPYAHITATQTYAPIQAQLSSLASMGGIGVNAGLNVGDAGYQLNAINAELRNNASRRVIAGTAGDIKEVAEINIRNKELQEMKDAIVKQLQILHTDNTNIQAIEADLAFLEKKHEAAGDLMKQFVMSNPEERFKIIRELNMAAMNNQAGNPMPQNIIAQQMIMGGMDRGRGLLNPDEAARRQTQFFLNSGVQGQFRGQLQNVKDTAAGQNLLLQLSAAQHLQVSAGTVMITAARIEQEAIDTEAGHMTNAQSGQIRAGAGMAMASGGFVGGSGSADSVHAMLTPGEFIVKKDIAQQNMGLLEALNNGYDNGGTVTPWQARRNAGRASWQARRNAGRASYEARHWRKSNMGNDDLAPESDWASNREVRRIHAEYARQEARERHLSPEARRILHENERLMKMGFSEEQITNNWSQFHRHSKHSKEELGKEFDKLSTERAIPKINGREYENVGGHIIFKKLNETLANLPSTFKHDHNHGEMVHRVIGEGALAQAIVGAISDHIGSLVNKRVSQSINPITGESNPTTYS